MSGLIKKVKLRKLILRKSKKGCSSGSCISRQSHYINKIIRDNLYLLYINDDVKKTFSPKPMISFKSARKLSSYLVWAALYPIERPARLFKCIINRC